MPFYKTRLHIPDCYSYKRNCKRKAYYEVKGPKNESIGFFCGPCAERIIRDKNKQLHRQEKSKHDRSEDTD